MSSSSSSSSAEGDEVVGGFIRASNRRDDPSSSSSSRRRSADAIWPEHFVEAVAAQLAIDAALTDGRLAAAPAIAPVFQVCSTWRAVSRSEPLWRELTNRVWGGGSVVPVPTISWRDEFTRFHRRASNFRSRRSTHSHISIGAGGLSCRRLALSDRHLAAGFHDGSVRLFRLPEAAQLSAYAPQPHRDRLGRFSRSISGLLLLPNPDRLVFASQDGDVHVAAHGGLLDISRAHAGNLVEDGVLLDFAGDDTWWVGLYAGVPGRSWHVWSAATEQLVYVGGSLTDPESVIGWHVLTDDVQQSVGRARILSPGIAIGCTDRSIQLLDLEGDGLVRDVADAGAIVDAFDASEGRAAVVDSRGVARVHVVVANALRELCRFNARRGTVGCMNWGYVVLGSEGAVRVWDARTGEYLYALRERIGDATVFAASDRYIAAWTDVDCGMHLWDFGSL